MQRDLDKRKQALDANIEEKNKLKRIYEESLARKVPNTRAAQEADKKEKVTFPLFSSTRSTRVRPSPRQTTSASRNSRRPNKTKLSMV
jgi:hypothetical protein